MPTRRAPNGAPGPSTNTPRTTPPSRNIELLDWAGKGYGTASSSDPVPSPSGPRFPFQPAVSVRYHGLSVCTRWPGWRRTFIRQARRATPLLPRRKRAMRRRPCRRRASPLCWPTWRGSSWSDCKGRPAEIKLTGLRFSSETEVAMAVVRAFTPPPSSGGRRCPCTGRAAGSSGPCPWCCAAGRPRRRPVWAA